MTEVSRVVSELCKSIACLALEVPASVHEDVKSKAEAVITENAILRSLVEKEIKMARRFVQETFAAEEYLRREEPYG